MVNGDPSLSIPPNPLCRLLTHLFVSILPVMFAVGCVDVDWSLANERQNDSDNVTGDSTYRMISNEGLLVQDQSVKIARPVHNRNKVTAPLSRIEDRAYFLMASRWTHRAIHVCWENSDEVSQRGIKQVEQAVKNTWEKYSLLTFRFLETCHEESKGIRILVKDVGAYTKKLGVDLDGVSDGMVLNFTFHNWRRECQDENVRFTCIAVVAVHEFGHALGFAHEHNRPDTPGECTIKPQGHRGDSMLTKWDPESVMNYCHKTTTVSLSTLDIEALQKVYGIPKND